MIKGFDVDSYNKPGFSFAAAAAAGFTACYIKLGGDNAQASYVMSSNGGYRGYTDSAVGAGIGHIGAYWATGGTDPVASAKYYLANLHPASSFDVLDNELFKGEGKSRIYPPADAYAWFKTLHDAGRRDLWMYASRLVAWAADDYTRLADLGVKALVADYGTPPMAEPIFTINYPRQLIRGHQWSSTQPVGGLGSIDVNVFTDNAFGAPAPTQEDTDMLLIYGDTKPIFIGPNGVRDVNSPAEEEIAKAVASKVLTWNQAQVRILKTMIANGINDSEGIDPQPAGDAQPLDLAPLLAAVGVVPAAVTAALAAKLGA